MNKTKVLRAEEKQTSSWESPGAVVMLWADCHQKLREKPSVPRANGQLAPNGEGGHRFLAPLLMPPGAGETEGPQECELGVHYGYTVSS